MHSSLEIRNLLIIVGLLAAMCAAQAWGLRLGRRSGNTDSGLGVSETAVFSMLGLFLAFAFSSAAERFDARRTLILDEANAIGTAWMRVDLLPRGREEVRRLITEYLDLRIESYRLVADEQAAWAMNAKAVALQDRIWKAAVAGAGEPNTLSASEVLLPALNDMFDVAARRTAALSRHAPIAVFVMLGALSVVGAVFAGYALAGRKHTTWIHTVGFPAVLTLVLLVIVDLEFPRLGFIRVDDTDRLLTELRKSLTP